MIFGTCLILDSVEASLLAGHSMRVVRTFMVIVLLEIHKKIEVFVVKYIFFLKFDKGRCHF